MSQVHVVEIPLCRRQGPVYTAWSISWLLMSWWQQGIKSHGFNLVVSENSGFITRRVNSLYKFLLYKSLWCEKYRVAIYCGPKLATWGMCPFLLGLLQNEYVKNNHFKWKWVFFICSCSFNTQTSCVTFTQNTQSNATLQKWDDFIHGKYTLQHDIFFYIHSFN